MTREQLAHIEISLAIIRESFCNGQEITSTEMAKAFVQLRLGASEREQFLVVFLNSSNNIIADEIIFEGTVDAASVWPREIIKRALQLNAKAIIIAHNHPSGTSEISDADIRITKDLQDACELMSIRLLDHIIAANEPVSFSEKGMI